VSSAQTEVRSALAAYVEGVTPLREFEQSVAQLLVGRRSARGIVHSELKAAVADGTLPPESLRRLGLVDYPDANEADNRDARVRDGRPRASNAARGRGAGPSKPRGRAAAPPPPSESPDTASDWLENRRATPQIPECGALLGKRYRLERVLGEGGMGVVFLAVDQEVRGEMFAIKVLREEVRANPESLRLLREEVRRTRALRHPNIVGVYSLNSDPSGVYMLMEYLDGKSLKTVLDEEFGRGMPLIRAWPMIYDVGAALAYAHDHNVIHSDIKPSNVIITSSSSCKLLDFGIARADRNRTTSARDATAIGALTPAYACCEMFEGRAPDQSDDVYAFACVIYEMLTGRHPYGRINAVDARARKLQPAPIKLLTNRQNQALARALEFDRERRTPSVEILLEGLKGMINNERDRRAWVTTAGGVAVMAVLSTGWFLEHRAAHRESVAEVSPEPKVTTADVPAAAPPALEPSPAGRAPPKADHSQPGGRPDLAAANPSTVKNKPAAPPAADNHAPASEPAVAAPKTAAATPNKAGVSPAVTPAPAPTAAPAKTPPSTATGGMPLPAIKTTPTEIIATPPAALAATAPVATAPVAAASTAVLDPNKTAHAPSPAPAVTADDSALFEPIKIRAKRMTVAALPAASATPDATAASPETVVTPLPVMSAAAKSELDHPPFGKKLPSVVATADSQAKMESVESCAYPAEARNELLTGTAVLLVYVLPDGSTANAQLDTNGTTGSPILDQAAIRCVSAVGSFPAKIVNNKPVGYWARTKFLWSFGG
jgi:TonB family protein